MPGGRATRCCAGRTKAWKNGRAVSADTAAGCVTAASIASLQIVIDDVLEVYRD